MHTVYIGDFGSGDLANEAALIEAVRAFPSSKKSVVTADLELTARNVPGANFVLTGNDLSAVDIGRVIICGPIISESTFEQTLSLAGAVQAKGGATLMHNVTLSNLPRIAQPRDDYNNVIRNLHRITGRDHGTLSIMSQWGLETTPRLVFYPERTIAADQYLLSVLKQKPILGISVRSTPLTDLCWEKNEDKIRSALKEFDKYTIVPLISSLSPQPNGEDDAKGFGAFVNRFFPKSAITSRDIVNQNWWRGNVTPQRLKGLVTRCDFILTQRDMIAAFAAEAGVPYLGLSPLEDDRVARATATLADFIAPGTRWLGLRQS